MDLAKKIIQLMIFAFFLGVWEVYGKTAYQAWVQANGGNTGVGEIALGYFIFLFLAFIVSQFIAWRFGKGGE